MQWSATNADHAGMAFRSNIGELFVMTDTL
jgi:hypothetical protein